MGVVQPTKPIPMDDPDEELQRIERSRAGDPEAFGVLVERYQRMVHVLAYRMTGSTADAEDLAQETFIRAHAIAGQTKGGGHPDFAGRALPRGSRPNPRLLGNDGFVAALRRPGQAETVVVMNRQELDALLRNSRPPDWPQAHWEAFPAQVVRRVRESEGRTACVREPRRSMYARLTGLGLAAACAVLALWLGPWKSREGLDPQLVTASARLVSELSGIFQNSLRAVIIEGEQNRILLSEGSRARDTEPVLVRLCHNGECLTIVTFSGERIEVGPLQFEVLAGGQGDVLLVGEDFVWSKRDSSGLRGWPRVEATMLSGVL